MLFILILIGLLIIVSIIQTALFQTKKKKPTPPPPYSLDVENPYFQRPLPYGYPVLNAQQKNEASEDDALKQKKKQAQQGVFYTLLFILGLIAFLLYQ
jgi:hypothetical protein